VVDEDQSIQINVISSKQLQISINNNIFIEDTYNKLTAILQCTTHTTVDVTFEVQ